MPNEQEQVRLAANLVIYAACRIAHVYLQGQFANFLTCLHKATPQNGHVFARYLFLALASRSLSVLFILSGIYGLICMPIRCRHFIVPGSGVTRSVSVEMEMTSENDSPPL